MGLLMRRHRDEEEKLTAMQELRKKLKGAKTKKEQAGLRADMATLKKMDAKKAKNPKLALADLKAKLPKSSDGADSKAKS